MLFVFESGFDLLDDLGVVALVHTAHRAEDFALERRHAGAHDAESIIRFVRNGCCMKLLEAVFATAANFDELIDHVEILDHKCCAWMLQLYAPMCLFFTYQ